MNRWTRLAAVLALAVLAFGAVRFVAAGFLPATERISGDFGAAFPTEYFRRYRPDYPQAWPGWNYGPALHFLTLPLLLLPRWRMVAPVWALTNLAALVASFVLACRLSGVHHRLDWKAFAVLAGLWLSFQPLVNCFRPGNIEIVEMALLLWAVSALQRRADAKAGVLFGIAATIKFLPSGFFYWLAIRRRGRAVLAGAAIMALMLVLATVTLGWKDSTSIKAMGWAADTPVAGLHELSITSMFLHRASTFDAQGHISPVRWIPSDRAVAAARSGRLASALLAAVFGVLLFVRRQSPDIALDTALLFMAMFMLLPWNHDYYYVFALVPFSIVFSRALARQDRPAVGVVLVAYLLMSPPVPFAWIDRAHLFPMRFMYFVNYYDLPIAGALLLWIALTSDVLADSRAELRREWSSRIVRRVVFTCSAAALAIVAVLAVPRMAAATGATIERLDLQPAPPVDEPATFAVSPDGSRLVYVARTGPSRALCVRVLARQDTMCLPGTERAAGPFFSPDSRWIGFFADGELRKSAIGGGPAELVSPAQGAGTGSWARDQTIVFAARAGIFTVASGPAELIVPHRGEDGEYSSPSLLPSRETVLFTIAASPDSRVPTTVAQSLRTGERTRLFSGGQTRFDAVSGRLVYVLGGRVLAVPFDPRTLALKGLSLPVAPGTSASVGDGDLVYGAAPPMDVALFRVRNWTSHMTRVTP